MSGFSNFHISITMETCIVRVIGIESIDLLINEFRRFQMPAIFDLELTVKIAGKKNNATVENIPGILCNKRQKCVM